MTDAPNLSEHYGKNDQEDHERHRHYADIPQVLTEMWIGQHRLLHGERRPGHWDHSLGGHGFRRCGRLAGLLTDRARPCSATRM